MNNPKRFIAIALLLSVPGVPVAAPTYVARLDVPVPGARFATAGDLDGDGDLDVVAISEAENLLYVYYNRGDGTLEFPPDVYPTDRKPVHVALGDITPDMVTPLPDIVVVTIDGRVPGRMTVRGDLEIRANSGAPPGAPMRFAAGCEDLYLDPEGSTNGNQPAFAAIARLDADPDNDILATSQFGNSLQTLYQGATFPGTCSTNNVCGFGLPSGCSLVPTRTNPTAIVPARFVPFHPNLDAAVLNTTSANVSYHLHLNPTQSAFQTINQFFPVGTLPTMMTGIDLTGDMLAELIVSNSGSADVSVLVSRGPFGLTEPIFEPAVAFPAFEDPAWVDYGEFELGPNEPGLPAPPYHDVVVANRAIDHVTLLAGAGDGTLWLPQCYPAGGGPSSVESHEMTGTVTDLVVANEDSGSVSVMLGRTVPNGGFDTAYRRSTGGRPSVLVGGDFDGDGRQDVVAGNDDVADLALLSGTGDGRFQENCRNAQLPAAATALAAGLFNGDPQTDLAVLVASRDQAFVFLGDAARLLSPATVVDVVAGATDLAAASTLPVVGDPVDLLVANATASAVHLYPGNGDGTFASTFATTGFAIVPDLVLAVDLDGMRGVDLVVLDGATARVQAALNDGLANFVPASPVATGATGANGFAVGEMTGDSIPDLAVTHDDGSVVVLTGDGAGSFTANPPVVLDWLPSAPKIGDFAADPGNEVLVLVAESDVALVLPWSGTNLSYPEAMSYGVGLNPTATLVGSYDMTGTVDTIVVADDSVGPERWSLTVLSERRWQSYPIADAGPDCSICLMPTPPVALGSPGKDYVAYQWSPMTVADPAAAQTTTTMAGTYTLRAANPQTGLENTDSVVVTQEVPPVVDINPDPAVLCTGDPAGILLDAGPGFFTYSWSTGDSGRFIRVAPMADTDYDVTVTTPGGCSAMGSRTVQVVNGINLIATVTPPAQCEATPTVFTADASLSTPLGSLEYQWSILEATTDWAIAAPMSDVTTITASPPYSPRVVTLRLELSITGGCMATAEFPLEVVPTMSAADVGNSLRMTKVPTGADLQWASNGAADYDVYSVLTKPEIPTIFQLPNTPDITVSVTNTTLPTPESVRYFQARGNCP